MIAARTRPFIDQSNENESVPQIEIDGNVRLVFNGLSHICFVLYGSPLHTYICNIPIVYATVYPWSFS